MLGFFIFLLSVLFYLRNQNASRSQRRILSSHCTACSVGEVSPGMVAYLIISSTLVRMALHLCVLLAKNHERHQINPNRHSKMYPPSHPSHEKPGKSEKQLNQ